MGEGPGGGGGGAEVGPGPTPREGAGSWGGRGASAGARPCAEFGASEGEGDRRAPVCGCGAPTAGAWCTGGGWPAGGECTRLCSRPEAAPGQPPVTLCAPVGGLVPSCGGWLGFRACACGVDRGVPIASRGSSGCSSHSGKRALAGRPVLLSASLFSSRLALSGDSRISRGFLPILQPRKWRARV